MLLLSRCEELKKSSIKCVGHTAADTALMRNRLANTAVLGNFYPGQINSL